MQLFKNRTTRALIISICALVAIALLITHFYYKNLNQSVDPRIVEARLLYENYNKLAQNNAFDSVFVLLDSIEEMYTSIDHYKNSYEIGVLYNNRAATFLTMALYIENGENKVHFQDSLMNLAEKAANKSILIYDSWLNIYKDKNAVTCEEIISRDFFIGLENYTYNQKDRFLQNRIKEVEEAKYETQRRLSVSYTNLGIVYRFKQEYESAALSYKKAMDLWDKNLTAENNLNVLLGMPLRERNFIQKLFPSSKDKD